MNERNVKSITIKSEGGEKLIIESVNHYLTSILNLCDASHEGIHLEFEVIDEESDILVQQEDDAFVVILYDNTDYWVKYSDNANAIDETFWNQMLTKKAGNRALLNSRNYVGYLDCKYFGIDFLIKFASRKVNFDREFEFMQGEVSDFCDDLLAQSSSYFETHFHKSDTLVEENINYAELAYLIKSLQQNNLPDCIDYVMLHPEHVFVEETEIVSICKIDSLGIDYFLNSMRADNLDKIDLSRSLLPKGLIPREIEDASMQLTYDTVENRFVKFFIQLIFDYLEDLLRKIGTKNIKLVQEISTMRQIISERIDNPFWKNIGIMTAVPNNSQILQRKYPYNQIFQIYNEFGLKSRLCSNDVDRKYTVGQKDASMLYQYWVFIKFFQFLKSKYHKNFLTSSWLSYNNKNLGVTLHQGIEEYAVFSIEDNKELYLRYNKKYSNKQSIYSGRSYSHDLIPDISLELYQDEALIGLIHFDAKYKLPENGTNIEDDINKMHAYKDGIMGSIGAYAICLSEKKIVFVEEEYMQKCGGHLFPSVGAFPLNICEASLGTELKDIFEIVEAFANLKISPFVNRYSKQELRGYYGLERIINKI